MPIMKQNDDLLIDVIYDTVCGYKPEEAFKILEMVRARGYIPIEFIQDEIKRFEEIGDNAIPKLQPKYYDRAKYLRELLSSWETFGRQWERKKDVTTPFD